MVRSNGHVTKVTWSFGYDEGNWYYGVKGKKGGSSLVRSCPPAQATLNFGLEHWDRSGFVE